MDVENLIEKIRANLIAYVDDELLPFIEHTIRKSTASEVPRPKSKIPSVEDEEAPLKRYMTAPSLKLHSQNPEEPQKRYMTTPSLKLHTQNPEEPQKRYMTAPSQKPSSEEPLKRSELQQKQQPKQIPQDGFIIIENYTEKIHIIMGPSSKPEYASFVQKTLSPLKVFTSKYGKAWMFLKSLYGSIKKDFNAAKIPYVCQEKMDYESSNPPKPTNSTPPEPKKTFIDVFPKKNKFGNMEVEGYVFVKMEGMDVCIGTQNKETLTKTSWDSVYALNEANRAELETKRVRYFDMKNASMVATAKRVGLYPKIICLLSKLSSEKSSSSDDESTSSEDEQEDDEHASSEDEEGAEDMSSTSEETDSE